jgi:hypothetical protein
MKRIRLAVTIVTAIFALTVSAVAMAAETTKILPEPGAGEAALTATLNQSKEGKLETTGGSTVSCSKAKGSVSFTSFNLGTGSIEFEGCKGPLSSTCTGEGQKAGVIQTSGTAHYLLALEMVGTSGSETTLVGAFVALQREFHFTCEALGVKQLVLLRGCTAGTDRSAQKLTKTVEVELKQFATGEQKNLAILPPEATKEVECLLNASINGSPFELAALESSLTFEKWTKGGKEIEVLLMNP